MKRRSLIGIVFLIALILLGWYLFFGNPEITTRVFPAESKKVDADNRANSFIDIIVLSSFSPAQSRKLSAETLKYLKNGNAIRILSANHLGSSYSIYDPESLDFYLTTVLTNTEKSTLNDVCNILTSSLADYRSRVGGQPARVFLFGVLPEAESKDDPALYCLSKFTEDIKAINGRQNIEFFTCINSEDSLNPLDRDLINLLADNGLKVSIIALN